MWASGVTVGATGALCPSSCVPTAAGDRVGAVEHLKAAAQGPDAAAKAAALQVLRSLGQ